MTYQISKYDAIKVVLKAKDQQNRLADDLLLAIRRAAKYEITTNNYNMYYIINEKEKKLFEDVSLNINLLLEVEEV